MTWPVDADRLALADAEGIPVDDRLTGPLADIQLRVGQRADGRLARAHLPAARQGMGSGRAQRQRNAGNQRGDAGERRPHLPLDDLGFDDPAFFGFVPHQPVCLVHLRLLLKRIGGATSRQ